MRAVIPRIRRIFAVFEPITLPKEIPAELFNAAFILTTNSGVDVPNATIVRPTIIVGI